MQIFIKNKLQIYFKNSDSICDRSANKYSTVWLDFLVWYWASCTAEY